VQNAHLKGDGRLGHAAVGGDAVWSLLRKEILNLGGYKKMLIKQAIGGFCGIAGILFLTINAIILARGASKWGFDPTEKIAYGAVAATVPFVIAAMPFLVHASWKPGRRTGRPSLLTLIAGAIWLVFVAYNLAGAAGSVALVREDVVSTRKHAASSLQADEAMRERLTREIDAISRYRPVAAASALLAAKKAAPEWDRTQKCTDIRRSKDSKFCAEVTGLEVEIAGAKRSQELNAQLISLNSKLEAKELVSINADPSARIIATFTGWDENYVSARLPLATPIILELGSMTLIYFAFVLVGFSHRTVLTAPKTLPGAGMLQQARAAILASAPFSGTLTRQRELCEWFFRECVRPATAGNMPEERWYRHYQDVCQQHNDTPLPLASFRRFAERCECLTVGELDGQWMYLGALPYVPRRAA
jgi:hypothetical protein